MTLRRPWFGVRRRRNRMPVVAAAASIVGLLLTAGCGTPTPTSTPTVTPTATPTPTAAPEPTATFDPSVRALEWTSLADLLAPAPVPTDPSVPFVYEVERIQLSEGYQFRPSVDAWGYNRGDRIEARDGDGILITFRVGDTLNVARVTNPLRLTNETNSLVNEELGINLTLAPDVEVSLNITFDRAGTFVLDDPAKPGALGKFVIVVEGS